MTVAVRLKRFLNTHRISYQELYHTRVDNLFQAILELDLNLMQCATTIGLIDHKGPLLAVIPVNHQLNLTQINRLLRRQCRVVSPLVMDNWFDDCEPGAHPSLAEPYRISTIIDYTLAKSAEVYSTSGSHTSLIKITQEDFRYLTSNQKWGAISAPIPRTVLSPFSTAEQAQTPSSIAATV